MAETEQGRGEKREGGREKIERNERAGLNI
jgi:hypothetical protein